MSATAWHYTVGLRAADILRDGFIKAATANVRHGERPIVWFSTRQDWEPTATKGQIVTGVRMVMTLQEMIEYGGGLWRFGLLAEELLTWSQVRKVARIKPKMARALVRVAEKGGADPYAWCGSLEPVAVERCVIQCRLLEDGEWGDGPCERAIEDVSSKEPRES